MPAPLPIKRPRRTLFVRVALLATLLVAVSVGPCAFLFMRQNRNERWQALTDQAHAITGVVGNQVVNAIPGEGKGAFDGTCLNLVEENVDVEYILVVPWQGQPVTLYKRGGKFEEFRHRPDGLPDPAACEGKMIRMTSVWTNDEIVSYCRQIKSEGVKSGLGWVYTGISVKKYEAAVAAANRTTAYTAAGAALAGIIASFFLARRIARPLSRMCDMADGIAEGNLQQKITVSSVGEVRHLAEHMNVMAARLAESDSLVQSHQRDLESTNERLKERVENEQLLSRVSADFLFAESSAPDALFLGSLERIARRLNVDGASIFLHDTADHVSLRRAWEWHATGAPECSIGRVPTAGFPWATAIATGRNVVTITDTEELPDEASAERTNLERLHIRSAAAALLGAGDKATGYLFLRNAGPRVWTAEEEQLIHLAACIFSNAIARREASLERERLHAQLLQAQKMEAVGKLSGGIAHDFNNMLVPIVGYSDTILNATPEGAPWLQEIKEIKRSAESAAALTRQLLTFSRRQIISRKEMDLNGQIQKLQQMMRRLIGENINLQTELAPDLWTVSADASQIEQCLMNLVVNAKAAMPKGGSILIATHMVDSEDRAFQPPPVRKPQGLFTRITVRDSGCGMDQATLTRIFEPFFSTKGEEGTGLGLSVVYGIMEEHGGWITVDSEVGKGTAFHLWIPALNEPLPQPMDSGLTVARPLPRGHGERILLIEDEPGVLAFVSAALRQNGYHVITADCGTSARQAYAREGDTLDLVMSDVILPDTTGVDLLEEFFRSRPELRALLSSGYSEKQALLELVRKRGLHFLHKPYTLIQLLDAVHKALSGVKPETVVA